MIRRPPRSTLDRSSAASDVYKRQPRTLVDIFRETVERHPDVPALDNGATSLTYAEFEEAASDLAEQLHEVGVGPGAKVGVRVRSGTVDLYVAIMAILVAGGAYVPVDADDPEERARTCLLYTSPRPRDRTRYRMPASACQKKP